MIRSFEDRDTRRIFRGRRVLACHGFADQAECRLALLDSTETPGDLAALKSNRLELLRGEPVGQHSIRINAQSCVCFLGSDEGRTTWKLWIVTEGKLA